MVEDAVMVRFVKVPAAAVVPPIIELSITPPLIVKSLSTSVFETTEEPATRSEAVKVSETFVSVMQSVQVRVIPPEAIIEAANVATPVTFRSFEATRFSENVPNPAERPARVEVPVTFKVVPIDNA